MKRPLIVLAVGFVLGEVLALQDHEAVFRAALWWTCAAAGVAGVWMYGILRKNPVTMIQVIICRAGVLVKGRFCSVWFYCF